MVVINKIRKTLERYVHGESSASSTEAEEDHFQGIYALENVDVSTVRPMGTATSKEVKPLQTKSVDSFIRVVPQLELDLGEGYREYMESFRLSEPVAILNLSDQACKGLEHNSKRLIRDLLTIADNEWAFMKNIGQGHIDEVRTKLNEYLGNECLTHVYYIDFVSLLSCLLASISRDRVYIALKPYGLESLFFLNQAELASVKHLNSEQEMRLRGEIIEELRTGGKQSFLVTKLREIASVFLEPWLRRRLGIGRQEELEERLALLSLDSALGELVMTLIKEVYFDGVFPFKEVLLTLDEELFVSDPEVAMAYRCVVKQIQSYFYQKALSYRLSELVHHVYLENIRLWKNHQPEFIEKVLRVSPQFSVFKGDSGELEVMLN